MDTKELYWAAGFLEGEGSFGAYRCNGGRGFNPKVSAGQNEREPLERLVRLFGGKVHSQKNSRCLVWLLSGNRGIGVMMTLWSLMGSRRRGQIELAIERWKTNGHYRGSRGDKNGSAKLTADAVRRVRKYAWFGTAYWATELGVSRVLVCKVLSRKIWSHVE